jgi:arylsulfatase A-like enzyme
MTITSAIIRLMAALSLFGAMGAAAAGGRPNLLLIIADDYATDGNSLYNTSPPASLPPTPHINALADSGVLFRNAYAYPTCSPTRCSVLTGRYGFRTGIGYALESPSEPLLTSYEWTIPEVMRAAGAGCQHALVGKWHLSFDAADPNTLGGFSHFSGGIHGALQNYYNWLKTVNSTNYNGYNVYATRDNALDAIAWLQQQNTSGSNWFLWLAFNASHTPYHKPPADMAPHYTSLGPVGDGEKTSRPHYEAITEGMDTAIGWVMTNVNLQTTTVLFIGDNGTLGTVIQPPYSTNHGKGTLYEGGIRVPMIIAGAGVESPKRECTHLVHTVDLYATILELAGINLGEVLPVNLTTDSRSLVPVLANPAAAPARDWVLSENFSETLEVEKAGRCIRNGTFKLIEFQDGRREFYDLSLDPYETNDLGTASLDTMQSTNLAWLEARLAALQNVPRIAGADQMLGRSSITVDFINGTEFSLWRAPSVLGEWARITNAITFIGTNYVRLTDAETNALPQFYRVSVPTR